MMKALVLEEFGTDLVIREVPVPRPGPGQVLVRVAASGVNPLDTKIRQGDAAHARVSTPAVLGIDLAGEVVDVGPGADRSFRPGDEVYGMTGGVGGHQGSLAEFAAVDADLLALKPRTLSMRDSAAVPLSVITAWEGLVDRADVGPGQRVLIHGGAGGVGHLAVQLARARDASVWATDPGPGLTVIRNLGAEPIDIRRTSVAEYVNAATDGEGFDVIFDTIGGETLDRSFTAVRLYTGHVVSTLGWGSHSLAPLSFRAATYSGVFTLLPLLTGVGRARHGQILRAAAQLIDAGLMSPLVASESYGWHSVMSAHRAVEAGSSGKVVVELDDPGPATQYT